MEGSIGHSREPDSVALGHVVARRRRSAGLTQDELAARAGMTRSAVYFVESGKKNVRRSTQRKIAEALGVTLEELLAEATPPVDDQSATAAAAKYTYQVLVEGMPGVQLVVLSDRPLTDDEQAQAWRKAQIR